MSGQVDLQLLADERELFRAMTRYTRALDARDWPQLDSVFAANATAIYGEDAPRLEREAIVKSIRGYLDGCGPCAGSLRSRRTSAIRRFSARKHKHALRCQLAAATRGGAGAMPLA